MKRNLLIAAAILLVAIGAAAHIVFYKPPEECFVREMKAWSTENDLQDKVQGITQEDAKMAVSKAKFVLNETDLDDHRGDMDDIYIQIGTLFEYCGVED